MNKKREGTKPNEINGRAGKSLRAGSFLPQKLKHLRQIPAPLKISTRLYSCKWCNQVVPYWPICGVSLRCSKNIRHSLMQKQRIMTIKQALIKSEDGTDQAHLSWVNVNVNNHSSFMQEKLRSVKAMNNANELILHLTKPVTIYNVRERGCRRLC